MVESQVDLVVTYVIFLDSVPWFQTFGSIKNNAEWNHFSNCHPSFCTAWLNQLVRICSPKHLIFEQIWIICIHMKAQLASSMEQILNNKPHWRLFSISKINQFYFDTKTSKHATMPPEMTAKYASKTHRKGQKTADLDQRQPFYYLSKTIFIERRQILEICPPFGWNFLAKKSKPSILVLDLLRKISFKVERFVIFFRWLHFLEFIHSKSPINRKCTSKNSLREICIYRKPVHWNIKSICIE